MITWRAGCGGSRTSGSEGGPGKPTSRKVDRAPRPDPYTKLRGPQRGIYYDLYVVLDIFSRYVVGWTVAAREDSLIAKELLEQAMGTHGVPDVVHADRGTSMTSKPVAQLLVDLSVTRSHSRPRVSNDNPYSESQFKTMKYPRSSPTGSAPSLTLAFSARRSSATTTTSTATPGSGCTPRPRSTTAPITRSARYASRPWTPPTQSTPNDSATADPNPRRSRPRPGSTSPHAKRSYRARKPRCLIRLDTFRARGESCAERAVPRARMFGARSTGKCGCSSPCPKAQTLADLRIGLCVVARGAQPAVEQ